MRVKPGYKIADKKAPRFRFAKWRYNFINTDLHKAFLKENSNYDISYSDFKLVAETINLEIINQSINNRDGILIPRNLGRIWLGLYNKGRKVFIESGLLRIDENLQTLIGKIKWDHDFCHIKPDNHEFYSFHAHRDFKGLASKAFIENPGIYHRSPTERRVEHIKERNLEENERNQSNNKICNKSDQDTE